MKNMLVFLIPAIVASGCSESQDQDEPSTQEDSIVIKQHVPAENPAPELESELKLMPVDKASSDDSFLQFRRQLLQAIANKDEAYIYSIIDSNIYLSFGNSSGLKTFKEKWFPEEKPSPFWPIMGVILRNGGSFRTESDNVKVFTAPYVFSEWPSTLDAFQYSAVLGQNRPVYKSTDTTQGVAFRVSYDILKPDYANSVSSRKNPFADNPEFSNFKDWIFVRSTEGQPLGYMKWDMIWSPVGYRALFKKKNGSWKLSVLIAGD